MEDFTEIDISHFNLSLKDFFQQFKISASVGVPSDMTMLAAAQLMRKNNEAALLIMDGEQVLGVLTEKDFVRALRGDSIMESSPVADFMSARPKLLNIETSVRECLDFVRKFEFRHIIVWDEERKSATLLSIRDLLVFVVTFFADEVEGHGMVRPGDSPLSIQDENFNLQDESRKQKRLNSSLFRNPLSRLVRDTPLKMDVLSLCGEVLEQMAEVRADICVVVEFETKVVGVVSERDFVKFLAQNGTIAARSLMSQPINKLMTSSPHCFFGRHLIAQAINNMHSFGYRQVIVVDDDGVPIGIVSLVHILSFIAHFLVDDSGPL